MEGASEGAVRGGLSEMVLAAATLVILTLVSVALFVRRKASPENYRRLPPGPRGWPVVGSLPLLGKLPHQALADLSTQYGPLMFMHLGSVPTLVVSGQKMAKEILKTSDQIMASRPDQIIPNYLTYKGKGFAYAPYGPYWRFVRRVCMLELFTTLRVNQFQALREGEVSATLQAIHEESQQGNALQMEKILSNMTTNITTHMMWKKKYFVGKGSATSVEAIAFQGIIREIFDLAGAVNIADYIPFLKPLSMNLQGYNKRMKDTHSRMNDFLENIIQEHQRKAESSDGTDDQNEDFVDSLLKISKKAESTDQPMSIDSVKAIIMDMIDAGTETSSTMIEWALTEIVKNPTVMRKAQDELDSVVGRDRLVREADIPNLKYIQAVIKETFRMHPALPFILPRQSMHDCEIAGYHVPAETLVFVNAWAIHRDPSVWDRPQEFNPDRFANSTVDVRGQDFELIPFGSGRRMCPGINLGLITVQYTIAQLVHAFNWTLPGNQKPEDLDMTEHFGLTIPREIPLKVMAKPRLPTHVICPTFS